MYIGTQVFLGLCATSGWTICCQHEVNMKLGICFKKTRFNDSESTLSFERQLLYTWSTFRFKTLQNVSIHLELLHTERSVSKIHNRGNFMFVILYDLATLLSYTNVFSVL